MPEYNYKDVIIDPEDPRVKIGAEYYWGESPRKTIDRANNKGGALPLLSIDREEEHTFPFYFFQGSLEGGSHFLIRKKELSYAERQEKWIEENDLNKGDRVRIIRKADSKEDGWGSYWNSDMDEAVGKVGTVCYILPCFSGIEVDVPDVGIFFYPYFVLKKVEPEYVPYDFDDLACRASLLGKVVKSKKDELVGPALIIGFSQFDGGIWLANVGGIEAVNRVTLLHEWMFLDGTPCGQKVTE